MSEARKRARLLVALSGEQPGDLDQALVATLVAHEVVVDPEVVEVGEEQRQGRPAAARAGQLLVEALHHGAGAVEAGQPVASSLIRQLGVLSFELAVRGEQCLRPVVQPLLEDAFALAQLLAELTDLLKKASILDLEAPQLHQIRPGCGAGRGCRGLRRLRQSHSGGPWAPRW